MTPGSAPAAGGEGDGPRLPPSLSAGSPSPEPHLVRSSERSCSFFPAGVWGRGGEGGTHTHTHTETGHGPGAAGRADRRCLCPGWPRSGTSTGSVVGPASSPPCLSQNKKEKGDDRDVHLV